MRHGSYLLKAVALGLLSLTTACSGCDDGGQSDGELTGSGSSTGQGGGSTGTDSGSTTDAVTIGTGIGSSGSGNPCAEVDCDDGFRCDPEDGSCVALTCEEADCSEVEECVVNDEGGAICVDISCENDAGCPPEQFCDGTICIDDICVPDASHCEGGAVVECASNGGDEVSKFECGSDAYFESTCTEDGDVAYCPCQDDWDCPEFTVCDVGQCVGTGVAPTCSLPPLPFDQLLPASEIQWGGASIADPLAHDSPFERSVQVVMTPLVVNLDDDNGDGLVNERDFPEIVFLSFCNSEFTSNGTLRAIHGGGPNKGEDYFATCGTSVWHEDDPPPADCASEAANNCAAAVLNSTSAIAAGDLDGDGLPEIVALTETRGIQIFSNDGTIESTSADNIYAAYGNAAPAIANLDGEGFAEIVVGRYAYTLQADVDGNLAVLDTFVGTGPNGTNPQGPTPCIANVAGDTRQELIAGGAAYTFPRPPAGASSIADCVANPPTNAEETAFCAGQLPDLWDTGLEGFCSVADVFGEDPSLPPGPDNPLDGLPEVVLVSEGRIIILDAETGTEHDRIDLGEQAGGAPNVDDFDGDGFPEVGTAFDLSYIVVDFQEPSDACPVWNDVLDDAVSLDGPQTNPPRTPPAIACQTPSDCSDVAPGTTCNTTLGTCVCLQNNWERTTEDDSSRVTGLSVFDFNGDGAAEVVYNDECYFRIYDGVTARVLFKEASESRTRIEYPVIADADNDGNAEIVFPTTTESGFCSENLDTEYNAGIEMWGDPSDQWVSARRIWNEHAYHVTNVMEGGGIPATEPESWQPWNGRLYNTYRSNPRSFGVAPDLVVSGVQVSSPDASCGELSDVIEITAQIANIGDLRVGPGVVVGFFGTWDAGLEALLEDDSGPAIQVVLQQSLEPGDSTLVTVTYDSTVHDPAELPVSVTVVVDELEQENECIEDNNDATRDVEAGEDLADLQIDVGDPNGCPDPTLPVSVTNEGSAPASEVVVRIYAGDPSQGGLAIHEEIIAGPIDPGATEDLSIVVTDFPSSQTITLWGVVDPDDTIPECDDADNRDPADGSHSCGGPG